MCFVCAGLCSTLDVCAANPDLLWIFLSRGAMKTTVLLPQNVYFWFRYSFMSEYERLFGRSWFTNMIVNFITLFNLIKLFYSGLRYTGFLQEFKNLKKRNVSVLVITYYNTRISIFISLGNFWHWNFQLFFSVGTYKNVVSLTIFIQISFRKWNWTW